MKEFFPSPLLLKRRKPLISLTRRIQKSLLCLLLLFAVGSTPSFAQINIAFTSGGFQQALPGDNFIDASGQIFNFGASGLYTISIQQSLLDDYHINNLEVAANGVVINHGSTFFLNNLGSQTFSVTGIIPLSANPCEEGNVNLAMFNFLGQEVGSFTFQTQAIIGPQNSADLIMRDDAFDIGAEPYVASPEFASPDIWVRRQLDGGTTHENPDFVTQAGNANRVNARIRNVGCVTSNEAELHLYWTRARTHETWDDHWLHFSHPSAPNNFRIFPTGSNTKVPLGGEITILNPQDASSAENPVTIPPLTAGQTFTINPVAWLPPDPATYDNDGDPIVAVNGAIHPALCLLARIVSPTDPMNNEQNPEDIFRNVRNNNNIVARNTFLTNDPTYKWDPDGVGEYNFGWTSYAVNNPTSNVEYVDLGVSITSDDTENSFQTYGDINVALSNGLWAAWENAGGRSSGIQVISNGLVRITDPGHARLEGIRLNPGDDFQIAFQYNFFGVTTVESDLEYNFQFAQYPTGSQTYMGSPNHMITTVEARVAKRTTVHPGAPAVMELNAYPNPAGKSTTVSFTLSDASSVTLTVRDIQGRIVRELAQSQEFGAGQHSLALDLSDLRSGVYVLSLQTPEQFMSKKLIHNQE